MPPTRKRSRAQRTALDDQLDGAGQCTGTRALMLAVLEEGIRSYLRGSRATAHDAEFWILSQRQRSPFAFAVVCETLGLDPDAVRAALKRMKNENVSARRTLPRARHNVRKLGRVHPRKGD